MELLIFIAYYFMCKKRCVNVICVGAVTVLFDVGFCNIFGITFYWENICLEYWSPLRLFLYSFNLDIIICMFVQSSMASDVKQIANIC